MQSGLRQLGSDILSSARFRKAHFVPHHFDVSVAAHSVHAADIALAISRRLNRCGASVSEKDAVMAGLLHDIGMTEDEVFQTPPKVKAYTHPVEGARIAREEFAANDVVLDAILYHMWPIGRTPPHHLLGWILVAADKWSFIQETSYYAVRTVGYRMARTRSERA